MTATQKPVILKHISQSHPSQPRRITVTSKVICPERVREARARQAAYGRSTGNNTKASVEAHIDRIVTKNATLCQLLRSDPQDHAGAPSIAGQGNEKAASGGKNSTTQHNVLVCEDCPFMTMHGSEFIVHRECHTTVRDPASVQLACPQCTFVPSMNRYPFNLQMLLEHLKWHVGKHKIRFYLCKFCTHLTTKMDAMETHCDQTHPDLELSFEVNQKTVITERLHCVCSWYTDSLVKLRMHALQSHSTSNVVENPEPPIRSGPVEEQPKKISYKKLAEKSNRNPSPTAFAGQTRKSKLECPYCSEMMDRRDKLIRHVGTHLTGVSHVNLIKCKYCPYISTARENTIKHVRERHPLYPIKLVLRKERVIGTKGIAGLPDEYYAHFAQDPEAHVDQDVLVSDAEVMAVTQSLPPTAAPVAPGKNKALFICNVIVTKKTKFQILQFER